MYLRELPLPPEPFITRFFRLFWRLFWFSIFAIFIFYVLVFTNVIPDNYKLVSIKMSELVKNDKEVKYYTESEIVKAIYWKVSQVTIDNFADFSVNDPLDYNLFTKKDSSSVRSMSWEQFLKNVWEDVVKKIPLEEITVKNISQFDTVEITDIWAIKVAKFINNKDNKNYLVLLKQDNSPYEELYNKQYPFSLKTDFSHTYVYTISEDNIRRVYKYMDYSNTFSQIDFEDFEGDIYILEGWVISYINNDVINVVSLVNWDKNSYNWVLPNTIQYDDINWVMYYISQESWNVEKVYFWGKQSVLELSNIPELKEGIKTVQLCGNINSCIVITTKKDNKYELNFINKFNDLLPWKTELIIVNKEWDTNYSVYEKNTSKRINSIAKIEEKVFLKQKFFIFTDTQKNKETLLYSFNK